MTPDEKPGSRASGSSAAGNRIDADRSSSAQRSAGGGGRRAPGAPPQTPNDDNRRQETGRRVWHFVAYIVVALIALYLFQQYLIGPMAAPSNPLEYSEFKAAVTAGQIRKAVIGENQITGTMADPRSTTGGTIDFRTSYQTGGDEDLVATLQAAGVTYSFSKPASPIGGILISLLPFLIIGVVWYFLYRRMARAAGGGVGGIFGVGKSKATKVEPEKVGITFKDVGGADEAIAELREIIQFLETPEQFARLGGRIPKGVLLVGPPGTGKTLLAKATAGEAGVPFFESSGSEFVEMFVGVGAARVRDLFEQARKTAPAIVFIDEIDAIGQSRGAGLGLSGANDEREQTLNQLLAEIDGFSTDASRPVIIMAATNRPEVLDQALLRAGRFDRQVEVGNPDLIGRVQILTIHSKGIKLARDFDLERAARITPGFSGADLANAMNEAALLAARRHAKAVTIKDFEAAMERVVAGLEKKSRVMNDSERRTVAYHESGHALVASLVPHADPVAKISIIPRARGALGYTLQMPTEDRYILTEDELSARIAVMLGGRAAEVTVMGTISTGAGDDIQKATELARRMITEFGMSEKLGSVRYAGQQLRYLGSMVQDNSQLSPRTQEIIDSEVRSLVTKQYERAQALLREHRDALDTLAAELLEHETLDGSAVQAALGRESDGSGADV
ncbi:MAG: ATP-dependent zinc metalloprotease FtsH [Actinobacteria bacterium]|jgi:cell division protease FtsH|nr:ATP-dependent zinc metalloprotease FtsH [Actinomycetota bacterium]